MTITNLGTHRRARRGNATITTRRYRVQRAMLRRVGTLDAPASAFRSRRGAIIAWLAIVLVVFGGSALQALMHHSRGV